MLEIKSDWQEIKSTNGTSQLIFTVYMKRDKEWFNCAVVPEMINEPDAALETLKSVMHNLIDACYPEISDPLYRAKRKLIELAFSVRATTQQIKDLEEARAQGKKPYEEDYFCEYKKCRVKIIQHYHIDEHTITFVPPKENVE